ncbi:MAG: SDR family oxidoreductase [Bacteriovoracaceae bacterium]
MEMKGNTVLITGGSSGIGMALVERFLKAGNKVITCGRDPGKLEEMKKKFPALETFVADTGKEKDRIELWSQVTKKFPDVNVLINNAGIQRKVNLKAHEAWSETASEININLSGPIHLSMLALDHLSKKKNAIISNVSSGLAFVPLTTVPVYCATKAAIHSFTMSLRHQLKDTGIKVIEIIPPAVRTNLGGSHDFGENLDEYADAVMKQWQEGKDEITYTFSSVGSQASRAELDQIFKRMNTL